MTRNEFKNIVRFVIKMDKEFDMTCAGADERIPPDLFRAWQMVMSNIYSSKHCRPPHHPSLQDLMSEFFDYPDL
jgi:hypothetical protein